MEAKDRVIVALDVDNIDKAIELVEDLSPHVGCFKIGFQFIYAMLSRIVDSINLQGATELTRDIRYLFTLLEDKLFLDVKLNDIPNTVRGATKEIIGLKPRMFNFHVSAGREAIRQAVANKGDSLALGVTVLTSLGNEDSKEVFGGLPSFVVLKFAQMLEEEGADGLVCSAKEVKSFNKNGFSGFIKVTPGIRPKWAVLNDQEKERVTTPEQAILAGADYLVIGRPITNPPKEIGSSVEAAQLIVAEIEKAIHFPRTGDQS